jgi:hypothetical protein
VLRFSLTVRYFVSTLHRALSRPADVVKRDWASVNTDDCQVLYFNGNSPPRNQKAELVSHLTSPA